MSSFHFFVLHILRDPYIVVTTQLPSISPSPPLALFPLLLVFTHLRFVHTDSTGNSAFYSSSACKTQLINNFTLGPDVCGNPFTVDDPLNTTIESNIIDERPTCSDGHIPTFYTYQGEVERRSGEARNSIESGTSCVNSSLVMAVAFICYGSENLDGNEWENTGGDDGCGFDGGNEEEMTRVGTTVVVRSMLVQLGMVFTAMVLRVRAATDFMMEGASQQAAQELSPQSLSPSRPLNHLLQ